MFGSLGFTELLIILIIVLVLFGGRKIPSLARDIGTGIREFKQSLGDSFQPSSSISMEVETKKPHHRSKKTTARKKSKAKRTRKKST